MTTFTRTAAKVILVAGFCILPSAQNVFGQSKPVSLEELAGRSEVVAVGKVKELTSEWDETGARIRTRVLLHVDQFIKGGGAEPTLTLYVPGGEVGGVGEMYSHMPTFKPEEHVIVFAEKDKMQRYRVFAGQGGKFTIEKDKLSGTSVVPGRTTLEEFAKEIKASVQGQELR